MKLSNSRGYCPPEVVQRANYIRYGMSQIQLGQDAAQVQSSFGAPNNWESYRLVDGRQVQVMFYQIGHKDCPSTQGLPPYLPMVFHNDELVGYGNDYYQKFVTPAIGSGNAQPQPQQGYGYQQQRQLQQHPTQQYPYGQPVSPYGNY